MKWPTGALDSIAILDRQSIHPSEAETATPYLGLEHLDGDGGINCVQTVGSAELKSNKFQFSDRHVLFGKLRPYLRKIARPKFSGVCSTDIIPILPRDGISRDYLFYFLRTPDTVNLATSRCSGVNLPRLSPSSPWQKSRIRPGPGAAEPRRLHGMAMGKRPVARQASPLWVETADLPTSDGHPFFARLNRVLEDCGFDAFVEGLCSAFYAARMGRPSLRPGRYFRMLLIGYFEGLSSERGIAWRVADSLSLRSFLDLELTESAPDHSTLSRTRRLIDVETHEAVFTWVLERLSEAGLVVGKTVGIDATTLEANAAMRSIERRDTGESYEAFIRRLAEASGVETPTRADLARFDRSRKDKKTSNKEWQSPQDPDAKIAKMKDGRTHLAHKAEHGVDMDTGAIVSVTVQAASDGDTATLPETLIMAAEQVEAVQPEGAGVEEVVADKGYHSDETLVGLGEVGVRSHVSEPERGRRCWQDKKTGETPPEKRAAQKALYANRRRVRGRRGRRLQRRRGEVVERTFAHMYETGGMRRVWVRGHDNVRKRVLLQAAACNIGLLLRRQTGVGTPRSLQGRALSAIYGLIGRWRGCWERLRRVWGLKRSMLHLEAA